MSAHLWAPAVEAEPLPATFSRYVLSGLLRDSLGFGGFVVTDDVKMGALNQDYTFEERVVRPLEAGADIILTPDDLGDAVEAVQDALEAGRLTAAGIDRSVRRILFAKARLGLHENRRADPERLAFLLGAPHGRGIAQALADRAVTLLKRSPALPLQPGRRVALVQLTNYQDSESITAAMDTLARGLGLGTDHPLTDLRLDRDPGRDDEKRILEADSTADVTVLALYLRLTSGRGDAGLFAGQERLVRRLLAGPKPLVLVTFGNPYAVTTFADADAFIVAYDQTLESIRTTTHILRGLQQPRGRLPVTVAPYPFGSGLDGVE
jgi:beta-N-acetylhexosaminidase